MFRVVADRCSCGGLRIQGGAFPPTGDNSPHPITAFNLNTLLPSLHLHLHLLCLLCLHSSNMSSLERIPNEISTEILSYLPLQTIACLSRLSRRMYSLSTPLLYKSMTIEGNRSPEQSSLQMILSSLLSPAGETLATYVRALDVKWDLDDTDLSRPLPQEILLFTAAAESIGLNRPIITNAAQFLLLLHLVPRLHFLKVAPAPSSAEALAEIIGSFDTTDLSQPSRAPVCFRFLRQFRSPIHLPTKALLVILHLPCIRTVDFNLINDESIGIPTIAALARTSSVTDLAIESSNTPAATLMQIFQIPTGLTSFSFRAGYHCVLFPFSSFEELLHSHRLTLKQLVAQLRAVVQPLRPGRVPAVFQLGVFHEWPALQSVTTSISALLGRGAERAERRLVDVLPRGLRELTVERDMFWTVEQEREALMQLLQDETAVPGLRKLVVRHGSGGQRWSGMVGACEAAGVALVDNGVWGAWLSGRRRCMP